MKKFALRLAVFLLMAFVVIFAVTCAKKKEDVKDETRRFAEDIKKQIIAMDDRLNEAEQKIKSMSKAKRKLAQDELQAMRDRISILKEKTEHFGEVAETEWADFKEKMKYSAFAMTQGVNAFADKIRIGKEEDDDNE